MAISENVQALGRRRFLKTSAAAMLLANASLKASGEESTDAVPPLEQRIQDLVDRAPLTMQFRGNTADECRRWQAEFGAKLRSILGPHQPPENWDCQLERRVEFSNYVREERVLTAAGLSPVPFYLLLPRAAADRGPNSASDKLPGILALHGHGQFGHDPVAGIDDTPERQDSITSANYDYGRKLAERGYVVAAPCLTPFGRRLGRSSKSDVCTPTYLRLNYLGKLLIAENLRDILWTLEFLTRQAAVDPKRIGCVGLSYGGRMTMLTTAVEPRIRVAVVSGALNCLQERTKSAAVAGCQIIPGLLEYGDVPEIGSLIAPRPCVWEVGSNDGLISAPWAEEALLRMGRAYTALGAANQLIVDRFEGKHEWHGDVAYKVLDKALRS